MTRNETRLTLEMKAKALQELIDDFTAQLREVEVTILAVKVQDGLDPNFVHQPVQLAPDFSALTTGQKPDAQPEKEQPVRISVCDSQMNILGSMIALEGPLTERPKAGFEFFLKTNDGIYSDMWTGCSSDEVALLSFKVYPHTPGGAAGAMLGFKPNKP